MKGDDAGNVIPFLSFYQSTLVRPVGIEQDIRKDNKTPTFGKSAFCLISQLSGTRGRI